MNLNMVIFGILMFSVSLFMLIFSIYFYLMHLIFFMIWEIMSIFSIKFIMMIMIDYMSLLFLWVVLMIYFVVIIYSMSYMMDDLYNNRFNLLVMLFVLSMCFMILSPNIMSILLGWDGLGLISYCLVIYYQSVIAYNSGLLTILCNRVGDIGLLMLISLMSMYGSWNMLYLMDKYMLFFLMLAIFTKSAQMPFSSWLPAAMVAPTPVSSLVHSSTLVTAGIYLLIRYMFINFENNMMIYNNYIMFISVFTMFMAGLIANFEFDLKKIIALSTLSQLGFMMSILSMGFYDLAFFHLIIHALFKSMMFLCGGGLIHLNLGSQDIRKYGNIFNLFPIKSLVLIVSLLSLSGFPFLAGFYSKDLIIEYFFNFKYNFFLMFMFYLSMILTVSYSFRLILWLFKNNLNYFNLMNYNEDLLMSFMQLFMFLFVVFGGYLIMNLFYMNYFMMMSFFNKLMILKIYFFGIYLGKIMYNLSMKNLSNMIFFFSTMFYLKLFYKVSYKKLFEVFFIYECQLEKGLYEMCMGLLLHKLMYFLKFLNFKNFNLIILMKFYLMMILLFMEFNFMKKKYNIFKY